MSLVGESRGSIHQARVSVLALLLTGLEKQQRSDVCPRDTASFGIMGDQLRALLKPLVKDILLRDLSGALNWTHDAVRRQSLRQPM